MSIRNLEVFLGLSNNLSLALTKALTYIVFIICFLETTTVSPSNRDLFEQAVYRIQKTSSLKSTLIPKQQIKHLKIIINSEEKHPSITKRYIKSLFYNKIACNFSLEDLHKTILSTIISQGYWKSIVQISYNKQLAEITLVINPGKLHKIQSINIHYPYTFMQGDLANIFSIKNIKSDPIFINNLKSNTLMLFKKNGFWNSSINLKLTKIEDNENTDLVPLNLSVIIEPGMQAKFGSISYVGNSCISESLLHKLIPFKTGDYWNSSLIYKAKQNLEALKVFDNIQILCGEETFNPMKKGVNFQNQAEIPITIELTEDLTNEMRFIFGLRSQSRFYSIAQLQKLNFNTGVCFEKKNFILPYDKINLNFDFDLLKKSWYSEYSYGKLKDFPFDITASVLLENTNFHSILPKPSLYHQLSSWCYTLSKSLNQQLDTSLLLGYNQVHFETILDNKSHDFTYLIFQPLIYHEHINGNWLQEKGTILSLSNKLMYSLLPENHHLGKLQAFATIMFPLNHNTSFALRIGSSIHYPFLKTQNHSVTWQTKIPSLKEELSDIDTLLHGGLFFNFHKHEQLLLATTKDYLIVSEKNLYIFSEIRRLLSPHLGAAIFYNFKFANLQTCEMLAGVGIRCNASLGGLILDCGWDNCANNIFWRLKLGGQF